MPLTEARAWGRSRCRKAECPMHGNYVTREAHATWRLIVAARWSFSSKDPARIPCRLPAAAGRVAGIWVFIVQCWY